MAMNLFYILLALETPVKLKHIHSLRRQQKGSPFWKGTGFIFLIKEAIIVAKSHWDTYKK